MKKFFYRVNGSETIASISEKFGVPSRIIISLNNLTDEVEAGDILYLEIAYYKTYTVRAEDTIESIAKKFGTTAEKILADNKVPYLYYGQIIIL